MRALGAAVEPSSSNAIIFMAPLSVRGLVHGCSARSGMHRLLALKASCCSPVREAFPIKSVFSCRHIFGCSSTIGSK